MDKIILLIVTLFSLSTYANDGSKLWMGKMNLDVARKVTVKHVDGLGEGFNIEAISPERIVVQASTPQGGAYGRMAVARLTAAGATVTGSSIKLVPTSYTYSLLAPAYKKFVKVYSGSDVRYAKVISGDDYEVNVEGLKSGETYTVVYEAVDYTGKVMARKYTLNVK